MPLDQSKQLIKFDVFWKFKANKTWCVAKDWRQHSAFKCERPFCVVCGPIESSIASMFHCTERETCFRNSQSFCKEWQHCKFVLQKITNYDFTSLG